MRTVLISLITIIISLSLVLSDCQPAQGQAAVLRFDRLDITDGLSQNTINAILQDKRGFIWIGTSDGLNRYDGYSFTVYRHQKDNLNSPADNTILSLYEDSHQMLWVGTTKGLDRYDPSTNSFQSVPVTSLNNVQTLTEDNSNRLWIGTRSQGMWVLDLTSDRLEQFKFKTQDSILLDHTSIFQILISISGEIWIATDDGLFRSDPSGSKTEHYHLSRTNPDSPTSNQVRSLHEDSSGLIWIGTDGGGINVLDPGTGTFSFFMNSSQDRNSLGDNRVVDILEDRTGVLWLATPSGLEQYNKKTRKFIHFKHDPFNANSISGSHLLTLFEDRSGVIWIGTHEAGLSRYRPAANRFDLYQQSLNPNNAFSDDGLPGSPIQVILEDRYGDLWIGGAEGTLSRFEPQTGSWANFHHDTLNPASLSSSSVTALAEDNQGRLWIGTFGGGLDAFDPKSGYFEHFRYIYGDPNSLSSNNISALLVDGSGSLWIGTNGSGLNNLDSSSGNFKRYQHDPSNPNSLGSDHVTTLFEDHSGTLWIGTFDGSLNRFDPINASFQKFPLGAYGPDNLSQDQVFSIAEYPSGILWFGTNNGLYRLDMNNESILQFQIPSNTINCILPDGKGYLWLSTTNGLVQFDTTNGISRTFTVADGLQSPEFLTGSCCKSRGGKFYFGGVKGLNSFYPDEAAERDPLPEASISAIYKNGQRLPGNFNESTPIMLSHADETIVFEFSTFDYNSVERSQFKYILEGFDKKWSEVGNRRYVNYTRLPPGNFIFHVRSADDEGHWSETGANIAVTVKPAFWQTVWFRVLMGMVIIGVFYGIYQLRLRSIKRRNVALKQQVEELSQEVKAAAVEAERNRMARDLHDSVTQSLYSLVLLTEAGVRSIDSQIQRDAESHLREIKTTLIRLGEIAQQTLQEMRLMVYQLRPVILETQGLTGALEQRLESIERRAGLNARLIIEGAPTLSDVEEQELFSLAQEALNNTLKHSGARSIIVRLIATHSCISLEVRDDGHGFDPNRVTQGGFGLQSMQQRAEKLGGKLEIDTTPGLGTRISFTRKIGDSM